MRVFSRNPKVPSIVEAMRALSVQRPHSTAKVDDHGLTDCGRLGTALASRGGSRAIFLFAFDLLALDGEDLRRHPWEIRRATLTGLAQDGPGHPIE